MHTSPKFITKISHLFLGKPLVGSYFGTSVYIQENFRARGILMEKIGFEFL